jgi:hypothetical protein
MCKAYYIQHKNVKIEDKKRHEDICQDNKLECGYARRLLPLNTYSTVLNQERMWCEAMRISLRSEVSYQQYGVRSIVYRREASSQDTMICALFA